MMKIVFKKACNVTGYIVSRALLLSFLAYATMKLPYILPAWLLLLGWSICSPSFIFPSKSVRIKLILVSLLMITLGVANIVYFWDELVRQIAAEMGTPEFWLLVAGIIVVSVAVVLTLDRNTERRMRRNDS